MQDPTPETCPNCGKVQPLCVCDAATPQENRVKVLILQHPQEPDKELGTARLANLILKNSVLRTGLSWPNLKAAAGADASPSQWVVLFLGSRYKFDELGDGRQAAGIHFLDRQDQATEVPRKSIRGVIVLDGTWAQAKTLWWRNPWLLKCRRAVIVPRQRSLYGGLRREPRPEALSTVEAIAATLEFLGEPAAVTGALLQGFEALLAKYRAWAPQTGRRASGARRDWRRRRR